MNTDIRVNTHTQWLLQGNTCSDRLLFLKHTSRLIIDWREREPRPSLSHAGDLNQSVNKGSLYWTCSSHTTWTHWLTSLIQDTQVDGDEWEESVGGWKRWWDLPKSSFCFSEITKKKQTITSLRLSSQLMVRLLKPRGRRQRGWWKDEQWFTLVRFYFSQI